MGILVLRAGSAIDVLGARAPACDGGVRTPSRDRREFVRRRNLAYHRGALVLESRVRSLKVGAALMFTWCGLNALVALAVTVITIAGRGSPALSLVLTDAEIATIDARVVGVVNAQAALANPCIIAVCLLVAVLTWKGLLARRRWAFRALVAALVPLMAFGFVSDGYLGNHDLLANVVSSAMVLAGLGLSFHGLNALDAKDAS